MFGIVIVAHGGLAAEYLSAVEHVLGKQAGTKAIAIRSADDREAKRQEISLAVNAVDNGDGVVVVTDMFGGTPSNLALAACDCENRKVIYGANLPMLVKLAKARQRPVADAIKCACDAGRKYLNAVDICVVEKPE